jgi:hypothetical protein
MKKFENSVPFDPGFSTISFSFVGSIQPMLVEYSKLKANHQKKFWIVKNESTIVDFISNSTAFYLGCMLWGAFIHYSFKSSPKLIDGNNTLNLGEEDLMDFDCAYEAKVMLEYIKTFNRDCKYFLGRSSKVAENFNEVLENYIDFAKINNNFVGIKKTDQIKIPVKFQKIEKWSDVQLDKLSEDIYSCISSVKISDLFKISL